MTQNTEKLLLCTSPAQRLHFFSIKCSLTIRQHVSPRGSMCGCVTLSTWSRASLAQSQEEMVSDIHISAQDAQDHGSHFINLTLNHVREEVGATAMHSPRHRKIRAQSECDHPLPHSRFNSHRTRLEDPISSDIEPGTQWNGTPGRPNHPHCSALLQRANEAPPPPDEADGRYHLLPFLGEIISLAPGLMGGSMLRQWPF